MCIGRVLELHLGYYFTTKHRSSASKNWVLRNTQPTPHMEQQHSQITYFCEEQIV